MWYSWDLKGEIKTHTKALTKKIKKEKKQGQQEERKGKYMVHAVSERLSICFIDFQWDILVCDILVWDSLVSDMIYHVNKYKMWNILN